MMHTRARQREETYAQLFERYEPLKMEGITIKEGAQILGVTRKTLGRAVRWMKAQNAKTNVVGIIDRRVKKDV